MDMMRAVALKTALLAAATLVVVTAAAEANPGDFVAYTGFSVVPGNVNIGLKETDSVPGRTGTFNTGEIVLDNVVGQINGKAIGPGATLDVWCLDLTQNLSSSFTYDHVGDLTTAGAGGGNPTLNATQINEIGDLMVDGISAADKVAIQLAIWKIEYPSLQILSGETPGIAADLTTDLNSLAVLFPVTVTLLADAVTSPDQAVGFAVPAVPIPGALALFAGGLGGLGFLGAAGRRRRRKEVARAA
jgi:hypothetical protein